MKPTLYIVSTPIGNYDDITLRGLNALKEADFIICEEFKIARRLLAHYGIEKELYSLNEHNEKEEARELAQKILTEGKKVALISDCGTPMFSDPGHHLLDWCISFKITIKVLPGTSSLIPALTGSNLKVEKFYHYGWLSPKSDIRRRELMNLKRNKSVIVLMDTPYRLNKLASEVAKVFGDNARVVVAFELTGNKEKFFRGGAGEIAKEINDKKLKGEFVFLVDNR